MASTDDNRSSPGPQELTPRRQITDRERAQYMFLSTRIRVAFQIEGSIASRAMASKQFMRTFEGTTCDGAIIVKTANIDQLPSDQAGRFEKLSARHKNQNLFNAIGVEIKSFVWGGSIRKDKRNDRENSTYKVANAVIHFGRKQAKLCGVLVVAGTDNKHVAVVPSAYIMFETREDDEAKLRFSFPQVDMSMIPACPLPLDLAPFIMPISYLPAALDIVAAAYGDNASDEEKRLYNPYTNLHYERTGEDPPILQCFDRFLPEETTEVKARRKIQKAFDEHQLISAMTFVQPVYAPLTSDIRLDHGPSGKTVFLEIKVGAFKISNKSDGSQTLQHKGYTKYNRGGAAIFTFRAAWDWLLSLESGGKWGYLIHKDEIPLTFWHQIPDDNGFLFHQYPDRHFLDSRKLDLSGTTLSVVTRICEILKGSGFGKNPAAAPRKSTLTAPKIIEIAGRCPDELFRKDLDEVLNEEGAQEELEMMEIGAAGSIEGGGDVSIRGEIDDDPVDEDNDSGDAGADPTAAGWHGNPFSTRKAVGRVQFHGGRSVERDAQLFHAIMNDCRAKGKDCPIFLGVHCIFGSIGYVSWEWSEAEKKAYDSTRQPPCWAGSLHVYTPMITIRIQSAPWTPTYAPQEGTLNEIEDLRLARPCVVFCTGMSREVAHLEKGRWIVPSEFLPDTSIGLAKYPQERHNRRGPLITEGQVAIDRFAVDKTDFQTSLAKFLENRETVTVGAGDVEFDPSSYVRTLREWRVVMDTHYKDI